VSPKTGQLLNICNLATIQAQQDVVKYQSLSKELQKLLYTPHEIHTIDCFDISHSQGHNTVGSCIRFVDGKPDKDNFRKFIIKTVEGNNDYACLREIVQRRYADGNFPDLILIDGGKGQLNAVKDLFPEQTFAALAKREETLFYKNCPEGVVLNIKNIADQTLIALRDYAHHFAISFHRKKETI